VLRTGHVFATAGQLVVHRFELGMLLGKLVIGVLNLGALGGELELSGEEAPLIVGRRVVAEPVEPRLARRVVGPEVLVE